MTLAASFLQKFYITVVGEMKTDLEAIKADPSAFASLPTPLPALPALGDDEMSGAANFLSMEKPSFSSN